MWKFTANYIYLVLPYNMAGFDVPELNAYKSSTNQLTWDYFERFFQILLTFFYST